MSNIRYILVGDMHVKQDSLDECRALILWIKAQCDLHGASPIFMGDQFDTHGSVRVEVLEFWTWAFSLLGLSASLVGNHDMDFACQHSSMSPFSGRTRVVRDLTCLDPEMRLWAIGYVKGSQAFEKQIQDTFLPGAQATVLCHQEFNGAMYESGFYAPGGASLDRVPAGIRFVSGHIHLKQTLGDRVIYVGTPRQVSRADSDEHKSVWLLGSDGSLSALEVPEHVCPRFSHWKLVEPFGEDWPQIAHPLKTFVDVYGSKEFISRVTKKLPEGVRVRTFPTRAAVVRREIKESDGIGVAFSKYVDSFASEKALDDQTKTALVKRLRDRCPGIASG